MVTHNKNYYREAQRQTLTMVVFFKGSSPEFTTLNLYKTAQNTFFYIIMNFQPKYFFKIVLVPKIEVETHGI